MNKLKLIFLLSLSYFTVLSQGLPEVELDGQWKAKMEKIAPSQLTFLSSKTHNVLVFSLHTGFKHWVIPHTEELYKILTKKTDGFNITSTKDIKMLSKENLKNYDAVILNNTCSIGDHRDMFWDIFKNEPGLDSAKAWKMAMKYEKDLIKYVKKGGGILAMHGGIVMQNKSKAFSEMMGGSFDYHPKQQKIEVKLVDASHPLVSTFDGVGFTHIDEPYVFNNAYTKKNFKPLMYYEAAKIDGLRNPDGDTKRYVSWIKKHGKGRVFYSSPSHNAQSFDNPKLLQFFLNGLQYVVGDVDCNDSPMGGE